MTSAKWWSAESAALRSADPEPLSAQRVAFHPPCTLQHGLKIRGSVEALLSALGFQLTPVRDAHLCCGSAGTYSILHPELSERLLENKIASLTAGDPDEIVTANIGCQSHLQGATRRPGQALDRAPRRPSGP